MRRYSSGVMVLILLFLGYYLMSKSPESRSQTAFQKGQYDESIRTLSNAIDKESPPRLYALKSIRGFYYGMMPNPDYERSLSDLNEAINNTTNEDAKAYMLDRLSDVLRRKRDYTNAVGVINRAISVCRSDHDKYLLINNRGITYLADNRLDLAEQDFRATLAGMPKVPAVVANTALLEAKRGNYNAARKICDSIEPKDVEYRAFVLVEALAGNEEAMLSAKKKYSIYASSYDMAILQEGISRMKEYRAANLLTNKSPEVPEPLHEKKK